MLLALWADRMSILTFEILLFLIGVGFGPTPSMTTVAMQNTIPQHQLGTAVGTMNFSRSLLTTILVALVGAIVLGVTSAVEPGASGQFGGPLPPAAAEAAHAFSRAFYAVTACLAISFVCIVLIEERPLRASVEEDET